MLCGWEDNHRLTESNVSLSPTLLLRHLQTDCLCRDFKIVHHKTYFLYFLSHIQLKIFSSLIIVFYAKV